MDVIRYRGAYRFADRAALDRAVAAALAGHGEWQDRFDPVGSALRVDLALPARRSDQQRAAVRVMQALATRALEGIVVARHRERAIDVFACHA